MREQILDVWRSTVSYSYREGSWHWGGRSGSNSISDAEQLLCILYPATNVPALRFDRPDETADDVLGALRGLGNDLDVARVVIGILTEYMERYRDEDGLPTFFGGSYVQPEDQDSPEAGPTQTQLEMEVVDAFSMSVTLTLATIGFVRVLRGGVRNTTTLRQIDVLEKLASDRLTAAMTALLRSFSVHVFEADSESGRHLCSMVNQGQETERVIAQRLSRNLSDIRASLREELSIGSGQVAEQLENPARLFECGWSWGVVKDAPAVDYAKEVAGQRPGVAEDRPYLYFTSVALDGIEDLFSERTRILGLLNDNQQRLAQALQLRFELCIQFWGRLATFRSSSGKWPLEDIPWRTTDGAESDYASLFVSSMLVQRLVQRQGSPASLIRVGKVFEELANRGRITRRPLRDDPALEVHTPGIRFTLNGSETFGKPQVWTVSSYSSLLLKRVVRVASLVPQAVERDRLIALSDATWEHMLHRRLSGGRGEGLWDQPGGVLPISHPPFQDPSWYHTQRIVECLVAAANTVAVPPPVSQELADLAREYLAEAEHLFDQEKLVGTPQAGLSIRTSFQQIAARLERARALLIDRPGTAVVLVQETLKDLDSLAMARVGATPHNLS